MLVLLEVGPAHCRPDLVADMAVVASYSCPGMGAGGPIEKQAGGGLSVTLYTGQCLRGELPAHPQVTLLAYARSLSCKRCGHDEAQAPHQQKLQPNSSDPIPT